MFETMEVAAGGAAVAADGAAVACLGWDGMPAWDDADSLAAWARQCGPDPWSAGLLSALDPARLSAAGRVDALAACWQLAAWVEANTARLLVDHVQRAGADAAPGWAELARSSALAEVGLAWGVSEHTVRCRWSTAEQVVTRLPRLFAAWQAGRTSVLHVLAVAEVCAQLTPEQQALVDQRVAGRATRMVPAGVRRAARTVATRLDPEAATRRIKRAHAERRVVRYTTSDGDSALQVWAGPRDIQAIWAALTRLAGAQDAADPRSLDNRRVDALVGLCLGAIQALPPPAARYEDQDPALPPARRVDPPVEAHLVIDLATLLGLADHPAELRGYGPIPPGPARDWLHDATTWRRLVTDPVTGHLLDHGPRVRFAPARLAAFLAARDQTCTFPGCSHPGGRCDADHQPEWRPDGSGGRTSAAQMAQVHRRHHQYKTHLGWRVERLPDGTSQWTSPTRHTHPNPRPRTLDTGDDPGDDP